jgi:type IV secretory pathway TraG/TraD family ATPase VirD4
MVVLCRGGLPLRVTINPAVVAAASESDFDFSTLRKKPQSLYIAVSEDHIATLAPLLRLLFADLIASIRLNEPGHDEPWPVMIMIGEFDEFSHDGRQGDFLRFALFYHCFVFVSRDHT